MTVALRRQRGRITAGVVPACLHQAAEAMVPVASGLIIDRAVATGLRSPTGSGDGTRGALEEGSHETSWQAGGGYARLWTTSDH